MQTNLLFPDTHTNGPDCRGAVTKITVSTWIPLKDMEVVPLVSPEPPQGEATYHSMGWRRNWRAKHGLGALWETFSVTPPGNVGRQTEQEMSGWRGRDLCGPHLSRHTQLGHLKQNKETNSTV